MSDPRYSRDEFGAIQALDDLGRTDDEIAARLKELGITGEVCMSYICAIANYLRLIFGQHIEPEVDPGLITIHGLDEPVSIWPEKPLADFIEHYDAGVYPDLISKEAGP